MKKKLFSILLLCAMLLSVANLTFAAEVVRSGELLDNGSFENLDENGAPIGLSVGKAETWEIITERAHHGQNAIKMKGEGAQTFQVTLEGIITGNEYTVSSFVKGDVAARASYTVEFMYYDKNDALAYVKSASSHYKTAMPIDAKSWVECITTFKAPQGAQVARVQLRKLDAGEVLWDKLSVKGEIGAPKCSDPPPPLPPMPPQGAPKPAPAWSGVKDNLILNPSMEEVEDGKIKDWNVSGGAYGEHFQIYKEDPHGGNNAGWMYHDERMSMGQTVLRIVPGETYKLSAWMKADKDASPAMKIEWSGYDETGKFVPLDGPNKYFTASDEWQLIEIEAVAPEMASRAGIMLRLLGQGSVYFDDVSFTGPQGELVIPDPKPYTDLPKAIDGVELLPNGGFESTDGIDVYKGEWEGNKYVSLDTERVWEGKTSLKISTSESGYPWARFTLYDLEPGAKYCVSAWMNADQIVGSGMTWKYEFYSGSPSAETGVKETVGAYCGVTSGGWVQHMDTFTVPNGASVMRLYARLYGTGTCWFDSMSLVKIDAAQPVNFRVNKTIIYNGEVKEITARFEPSQFYKPTNGTAKFIFNDGTTVYETGEAAIVDGHGQYTISTAPMTEYGKEYYVDAELYKEDGSLYRTYRQIVHVYPRPEKIRYDGVYLDENDEPFVPVTMYHVMSAANVAPAAEAGINVIQGYASDGLLEECAKHGVQLLAVLYPGMKPAGHPANIQNTINTVTKYKDHPSIFAWAVMDEPNYNMTDPYELLRISYKTIRDIDKKHPVYIVEEPSANAERTSSYADAFCIDPYITNEKSLAVKETHIYNHVSRALKAPSIEYTRPVLSLNQTYDSKVFWPNENDYRHQMYQAFFAGASGVGGYSWDEARPKEGETSRRLDMSDLWPGMVAFAENELPLAGEHFVLGKYPVLNEEKTDKIWHHSFIANGEVYVVALNLTNEAVTYDIPLVSFDGKVKVSSGNVSAIGATAIPTVGDGKMTVTLEPSQCVRYRISGSGVDASGLHESMINDIYEYPWARAQILEMEARGIANVYHGTSYAPGTAITRGDFAMFLVRTLGLTNEPGEQFADVDPTAEYAKELAIGRAAGILNGIGENKYNPEAPITRQELMTIISRGLALSGAADMSAFSDGALVSDWAATHVSAMIASGLIKGNADGTLNPLGNTTRAETAVICQRILDR